MSVHGYSRRLTKHFRDRARSATLAEKRSPAVSRSAHRRSVARSSYEGRCRSPALNAWQAPARPAVGGQVRSRAKRGGAPRQTVCWTCSIAWGCESPDNLMEVKSSEAQGRNREGPSEGSVEQSRDPTNRNRIRGRVGRTSGQSTAKSISINGQNCKSGGCAAKAVELTPRDLRRVLRD
jgi:hypothetical protein